MKVDDSIVLMNWHCRVSSIADSGNLICLAESCAKRPKTIYASITLLDSWPLL